MFELLDRRRVEAVISVAIGGRAGGEIVVFYQNSAKFKYRYSTVGFQDAAHLDDGDLWPVSYALQKWNAAVEKKVAELVKAAVS